jgi:hypothetical protein
LQDAADVAGRPDAALLERAARLGLRDPVLHGMAGQLIDIALRACYRMGAGCSAAQIDQAAAFFDRFTRQGRSPGDEAEHLAAVATAA